MMTTLTAPFRKVLIANRGEVARRIARTCRRLGIAVATIHSDADRDALHVADIGESYRVGGAPAADSYLRIDRVIDAARRAGAQAIHPGFGFLSENAAFAQAVEEAGLVFVGPRPQVLRDFGDKAAAKRLAREASVPTIPGSIGASADPQQVMREVQRIGLPVLLKAAAGGGGKGIRVVAAGAPALEEIASAMREAASAFGDPSLLVERYLPGGRHIEVQILGDGRGNVLHLWERECSLQRRHQKVIEEAPALPLPSGLRERILASAVALARRVDYRALGTVEFLIVGDEYFFLEVNPRLQVEHPVTEAVTGLDLVEWQMRAAAGQGLPCEQAAVRCTGHAIEVRLYAEDPDQDFLPAPGRIDDIVFPDHGVRIETGVATGSEITPYYDPMIAKLIVDGADRPRALAAMNAALDATRIDGPRNNLAFLRSLMREPAVTEGTLDTGLIDRLLGARRAAQGRGESRQASATRQNPEPQAGDRRHRDLQGSALQADDRPEWPASASAIAAAFVFDAARCRDGADTKVADWRSMTGWRLAGSAPTANGWPQFQVGTSDRSGSAIGPRSEPLTVSLCASDPAAFDVTSPSGACRIRFAPVAGHRTDHLVSVDAATWRLALSRSGPTVRISDADLAIDVQVAATLSVAGQPHSTAGESLLAPMMGKVLEVRVAPGASVSAGDVLVVIESMKMELRIEAPHDGIVGAVGCTAGANVERGARLIELEPVHRTPEPAQT